MKLGIEHAVVQEAATITTAHGLGCTRLLVEDRAIDGETSSVLRAICRCGRLRINARMDADGIGEGIGVPAVQEVQQVFHRDLHQPGCFGTLLANEGGLHLIGGTGADDAIDGFVTHDGLHQVVGVGCGCFVFAACQ